MKKTVRIEPIIMFFTLIRWFILASIAGLIVGSATSLFLHTLFFASGMTVHIPLWVHFILLPIGGLVTGLLIHYGAPSAAGHGTEAVITAVHENNGQISAKVAPVKTLATVITLACGGSAGKEGPCAQIGGALASLFANIIRLSDQDKKRIVICGISAGFASVFGTPIAATIFGIEVLAIGGLQYDVLLPSFIAGITSYEVSRYFRIPYSSYIFQQQITFSEGLFLKIILLGILCGIVSWIFISVFELLQNIFNKFQVQFSLWKPSLPTIGGILLSILILFLPSDYLGLSLPLLDNALKGQHIEFLAFAWKLLFVSITLASGFSGGIVTPLFVIGATAGNAFSHILNINPVLGADVGMAAVLASAANTPISAVIMSMEMFGGNIGLFSLAASITAYIVVGHRSVYPSQIVNSVKSAWIRFDSTTALDQISNAHVSDDFYKWIRNFKLFYDIIKNKNRTKQSKHI